jgi:pimeloyl-ACP methyl ester carboxylesterase
MRAYTPRYTGIGIAIAASVIAISCVAIAQAPGSTPQPADNSAGSERCSALLGRKLGGAIVDKADSLSAGASTSVFGQKAATNICRISAHISPAPDSEVKIRVWLPGNWNGKLFGFGGGGFNGSLSIDGIALTRTVNKGYAAVSTDAGHDASEGAKWALGHPEKVADFGHRANHVGAVAAKAITAEFYRTPPKRAYFHGCSNGGRDALMLAQRYPDDYDAIIAGAPANSWTALMSSFARSGLVTRLSPGADALAPKLKLVHEAAIKQCDMADGAKDGLIGNPATCRFDPAVLQCKPGSESSCLSKPEVGAFRAIYAGTKTRGGQLIMPGFPPGSELDWANWFTAPTSQAPGMAQEFYRNMVYSDPDWDRLNFVLDRDYPVAKRRAASILDATDTDLRPFARKGGKLLMYHGWDDPAIPAGNSIRYFEDARRVLRGQAGQARLFMVPGMAHCGDGSGPNSLDWLGALDSWVESGKAPERLTATRYADAKLVFVGLPSKVLKTRPVCAWPKTPHYKGAGALDDEASFICS